MVRNVHVVALAASQGATIIGAVESLSVISTKPITLAWNGIPIALIERRFQGVSLPWISAGTDGKWDIYFIFPITGEIEGRKLQRRFKKASLSNLSYIRGPWSPQDIRDNYAAAYAIIFPDDIIGLVIEGDSDAINDQVDYRPTDEEAINDIDVPPA